MDILSAFSDDKVSYVATTKNQYVIIDTDYLELVRRIKWRFSTKGYATGTLRIDRKDKTVSMHRLIFLSHYGLSSDSVPMVDHINRDKLDNRLENLRLATGSQNLMNRGSTCVNTSGYKGVSEKRSGVWRAVIGCEGKQTNLGHFSSPEEAALAYNTAARELHGDYALLNVVNTTECNRRKHEIGGVSRDKDRWRARLTEQGKRIHIGSFATKEEAIAAVNKRIESILN